MNYVFLVLAILLEVAGTGFLKMSDGFTHIAFTLAALASYGVCFYFLSLALRSIPLGAAYAMWSGVGIICTTLLSVFLFKQGINAAAIVGTVLILAGVVVMNLFSTH